MRHLITILTFVSALAMTGCSDIVERTYWRDGNYVIRDPGGLSNLTLYYDLNGGHGRVNFVSKIGVNSRYIIVESNNHRQDNKIEYWILDKTKDNPHLNANEIMEGPLSHTEFNKRKDELLISNLSFEKEFE